MRRCLLAALTAVLLLALAAPASAHPRLPVSPTAPTDLTHASTDNVEYLGRFPEHSGNAGGTQVGDRFYLTDPRGVYVYDVSTPESPQLLGGLTLPQSETFAALAQEDPDTNGEILLVDALVAPQGTRTQKLHVVDVSDPANMSVLSTVTVNDHTWTCISGIDDEGEQNSCAYAYGRSGHIIDLTNPAEAALLDVTWRKPVGYGDRGNSPYTHDLTEIRPGLVMSAGSTAILMDTTDPTAPVRLAAIEQEGRFSSLGYHSVEWPQDGNDRYVILGTEISPNPSVGGAGAGSDCNGENSVIETWDASEILAAFAAVENGTPREDAFAGVQFRKVDEFDAGGRGIFLQGQAPGNVLYCAHWMEPHPAFENGGLLTVSYYDRGTRFVRVADDGTMSEMGWMTPAEGYSGSSQWIEQKPEKPEKPQKGEKGQKARGSNNGRRGVFTDIVYVMDYRRGLEILQVTHSPAQKVNESEPGAVAVGSRYVPTSAFHLEQASGLALALFGALMFRVEYRRRRRHARGARRS